VRATIVAGNEAPEGPDVDGENFVSGGYNLIGNLANDGDPGPGGFQLGVNHDQVGGAGRPPIDPRLAALGDNGGRPLRWRSSPAVRRSIKDCHLCRRISGEQRGVSTLPAR
jgi:hypothetical protein